jgi:Zn-dependent protease
MFYRIDSTRITLREYWWALRSPVVIVAALLKFLRIRLDSSSDDPNVDTLVPYETAGSELPANVREVFAPLLRDFAGQDFEEPVYHAIEDAHHFTQIYLATLRHRSGRAFGRIQYRVWRKPHPPKTFLFPSIVSVFTDRTFLATTGAQRDLASPPTCRVHRMPGAGVADLWAAHERLLREAQARQSVVPVTQPTELRQASEWHHGVVRDFHLMRGVFVPMSETEVETATVVGRQFRLAEADGLPHAEVLAELRQLEKRRPGWGPALLVFAASLLLFFGAASARWSVNTVLLLLLVLFLHEAGHYLAMRRFKYRNVRMFFIPFFGAAVSGRHYNVPGWKKATVSLMGPVPGIVLGTLLGSAGLAMHQPWLVRLAVMMLILNGINLLPVLPLDGGWIMHTLFFSRHSLWDRLFRLAAAAALIFAGLYIGDWVFAAIGVFMLLGLSTAIKLARISSELRLRVRISDPSEEETVPTEIALVIIDQLKKVFPKGLTSRAIAQHALHVYETLNSRPPAMAASIGFFLVYLLSGMLAFLSAGFFVLTQRSQPRLLWSASQPAPQWVWTPEATFASPTMAAGEVAEAMPGPVLIANFESLTEARKVAQELAPSLPPEAQLELFGQTVLLAYTPANDPALRGWDEKLRALSANTLWHTPTTPVVFLMACEAPSEDAAHALHEEISEYLLLPADMRLIPPWTRRDGRPPSERARHRLARRTYIQLQQTGLQGYQNPTVRELQKTITALHQRGDLASAAKNESELIQRVRQIGRHSQAELIRTNEAQLDRELVALYQASPTGDFTSNWLAYASQNLAPRMGQLPMPKPDGQTARGQDRYSIRWGNVVLEKTRLHFHWLTFSHVMEGPPALAHWLNEKGCFNFQYAFRRSDAETKSP